MGLKINPELQAVVAPLTTEECAQLRDNIHKDGLLEPITLWAEESGTILDGHNRYAICQELRIGFKTKELSFPNIEAAKLWILEHQVGRRNLTDDQRAIIWNDIYQQRAAVSRANVLSCWKKVSARIRSSSTTRLRVRLRILLVDSDTRDRKRDLDLSI